MKYANRLTAGGSSVVFDEADRGIDWLALFVRMRQFMIAANVALLAIAFIQMTRLLGIEVAALGALLIALDPYTIALTRLFGVDGLTGALILVSILGILSHLARGRQWTDLAISAVAGGLAMLTRSTSIVLAAFVAVLVVFEWRRCRHAGGWRDAVIPIVAWMALATATCVLLWPALRLERATTVLGTLDAVLGKAGAAHEWQTFFNGQIYQENPEALFYPVVYLWRTTPAAPVGLLLTLALLLVPWTRKRIETTDARIVLALLVFAVAYGAMLTVSPKKLDRYLIPVFPHSLSRRHGDGSNRCACYR